MLKKSLVFIVLTVMLVTLMGACGKSTNESSADPTMVNTADINFKDADGEATYNIVRPTHEKFGETAAAAKVFKKYKDTFMVTPKNISDDIEDNGGYEILIGDTNRSESALVKQQLIDAGARSDGYAITSVANKIVIVGMSGSALYQAVTYFIDNYLTGSVVTGGINYIYNEAGDFNTVTIGGEKNLGLYNVVYPRYNLSYIVKLEIDALVEDIGTSTGYVLGTLTDFTVAEFDIEKVESESSETEIIVGDCTRDGVGVITDKDKYEIRIEGKKVYLNGGSPKATAMAVAEFAKMVSAGDTDITDASSVEGSYSAVEANYSNADNYKLTWGDDFE